MNKFNKISSMVFSYKFILFAMTLLALGAGVATFIESYYDTQSAKVLVYNAHCYEAIMGVLTFCLVGIIIKTKMHKRAGAFILHVSFIVILLGSFMTRYGGHEGVMQVKEGEVCKDVMSVKSYFSVDAKDLTFTKELALSQLWGNNFTYSVMLEGKPLEIKYKNFTKGQRGQLDSLFVEVRYEGESLDVKVEGGTGWLQAPTNFKIGGQEVALAWGSKYISLPFSLKLVKFNLERYAGSNTPSDFYSEVEISDLNDNHLNYKVSMNNPVTHNGYKIFQSSYDKDEKGTMFEISRDPGKLPTYIGYFLLCVGFVLNFFTKGSRFLYLTKFLKNSSLALLVGLLFVASDVKADEDFKEFSAQHANKEFSSLLVQDLNGRIKPLSTQAREIIVKITSKDSFEGMSAEQFVLALNIDAYKWRNEPIIAVKNPDIKNLLGVSQETKFVSFASVFNEKGEYILGEMVNSANQKSPSKRGKLDNDLIKFDERLNIAYLTLRGTLFRFIPLPNDENNKWLSPNEAYSSSEVSKEVKDKLSEYTSGVQFGAMTNQWDRANNALEFLKAEQQKNPAILPSPLHVEMEIVYNNLDIFKRLVSFYLIIGLFAFVVSMVQIFTCRDFKTLKNIALALLALCFIAHTFGLGLRWYVSGHAPWSDSYESMVYIAWSGVLAGLLFFRKSGLALSSASLLAGIMMFVAHLSFMNPQITNLVPVLKSYWLIIHVSVITASYGFLGLGALLSMMILILMSFKSAKNSLHVDTQIRSIWAIVEVSLLVGICLLTIGNFLGGVWANESWGRYWGWDPKETWSFVSIVVYAIVLHFRFVTKLNNIYSFALGGMWAYGAILMTYFGVNFYLTGLHSYGVTGYSLALPSWVYIAVASLLVLSACAYRGRKVKNI